jgi:hypothetical protein
LQQTDDRTGQIWRPCFLREHARSSRSNTYIRI